MVWHVQEIVVKEQEGGKCGGSSGVAHHSLTHYNHTLFGSEWNVSGPFGLFKKRGI